MGGGGECENRGRECIDIKQEDGIYIEEEGEEEEEIDTKEGEDVDVKEEVSLEDTV